MRRVLALVLLAGLSLACDSGSDAKAALDGSFDAQAVTDGSTSALAAHYAFDGSYRDGSGNGLDCTSRGVRFGPGRDRRLSSAAVFDGTAHLDCGDVLNDLALPFSIAAWIYVEPNTAPSYLVATDAFAEDGTLTYRGAFLGLTDGRLGLDIANGGPAGPQSRRSRGLVLPFSAYEPHSPYAHTGIVQTPLVPRGRWVLVTGVAASLGDFRLYIDGLDVGGHDTGQAVTLVHGPNRMRLGMYFKGRIDDLRIYRSALTETQIERLMAPPPAPRRS